MVNKFKQLKIQNWRQFDNVSVEFGERMTILTGANGSGKTTLLNLLSRHFGWSISFISTLSITRKGARKYYSGAGRELFDQEENTKQTIGQLDYSNDESATLLVPPEVAENYNIIISGQQSVSGIYITSHRPVYSYQRVDQIPTQVSAADQLFEQYVNNLRQYYAPRARIESPSYRLKSSLISLATFGYGNQAVDADKSAQDIFESFQNVLRKVLPSDLGFKEIKIRLPDVLLRCEEDEFSIDAASGGIAALIDLAWQLHMKSLTSEGFVAVLDEPENHLHPRLQRTILPGLVAAFPETQFIVATHNPFIVTSVEDSKVVILDFVDRKVRSKDLSDIDRAASANQVLMDVLGVPFPMPLWVENEIDRVVSSLSQMEINADTLSDTKNQLKRLGLGNIFPEVVNRLISKVETEE